MAVMTAVDVGAQSGRVALGRFDGEHLSVTEVHRFANTPIETYGHLHWDIRRIYDDVLDGLGHATAASVDAPIDSVGVDSWGVDFGLLDREGNLLADPVHYRDGRRAAAYEPTLGRVPARELYERTGVQLMPINTVFELAALAAAGDPILDEAETLLLIPDLLHHWLCGSDVTERTNATTTQCYDSRAGAWAGDVLDRLGIPARVMPQVVAPCTPLGSVLPEVATVTGLAEAQVVAVATHDTGSAVAAVPFRRPGSAFISCGTWSLVGVELDAPLIDDRTFAANLTNEGGIAGTSRLLRNVAGLWLLHECRRTWALAGEERSYEELVALATDAPALRAFVDPDDPSFAEPGDMPERIRAFCRDTDQEAPEDTPAVVRCILESLALKQAHTLDVLREATGLSLDEIHVVGGGAQNELLCRWTADAAAATVLAGPAEATVIGNLLGQALALGELSSLAEAREVVRSSFTPREYQPSGAPEWTEARERFAAIISPAGVGVGA
jgi:rhamnulokinase